MSTDHPPSRGRALAADDSGMTLVELVVYGTLTVLLGTVIASVFASSLQAEATTRDRTEATGTAQLIGTSIQTSLRNSNGFDVAGGILRARVAVGSGEGWECRAWRLQGGRIEYSAAGSAWKVLGAEAAGATITGTVDAAQPFEANGRRLLVQMDVTVGDATAPISLSVVAQGAGRDEAQGAITCW